MMNTLIKSALNQIRAEDTLKESTKQLLQEQSLNNHPYKNIDRNKGGGFSMKKFVFVACSLLLLCGLSVGGYAYYKSPVSFLSLDINPSVELGVNAFGTVVSAASYNADGSTILQGQNVTNCGVKDAVQLLVLSAQKNGFINSDGSTVISLTAETNNAGTASSLEESAGQGAQAAIQSSGAAAVVYKTNVALDRRDEARSLGITPGKLNLIQKLQALDSAATVDEYKDAKVTDIMKKITELKKSSGNSNSQNPDLSDIENAVAQVEKNQEQEKNKQTGQNQEKNMQQETNGATNGNATAGTSSKSAVGGNGNGNGNGNSPASNAAANTGSKGQAAAGVSSGTQSGQNYSAGQGNGNVGSSCPDSSLASAGSQANQNQFAGQNGGNAGSGSQAKGKQN